MKNKSDNINRNKTGFADANDEKRYLEEKQMPVEEKFRNLISDMEEGYFEVDLVGNFTFLNDIVCNCLGYSKTELIGFDSRKFTDKNDIEKVFKAYKEVYKTGKTIKKFNWQIIVKDGSKRYIEGSISLRKNLSGKPVGFRVISNDITERKQVENSLRLSEEKYRSILDNIRDSYFEVDLAGNFTFFNDSLCRMTGCSSEELSGANYRRFSDKENSEKVFQTFNKIYKTGAPNEGFDWLIIGKDGTKKYIEASASLRKDLSDKPIGFRGILRDITERKKTEDKLQQTLESLKNAVGTTIQVLVAALESRDPYTTGHQSQVASLACAIATEMGLDKDRIEGIRMAGIIHDIGKLSIPAEILTKPTKLTSLEFSLIQEHSSSGYEMLKNVESPWPLAQIVHQHHERINGSGYPRNLKGEEIILEARIMAVADVVEAMASHRPYRASLGIGSALEEIEKNKGILYDDVVSDTCLKLFREKGYEFA
ncbi:MAG: PAS domain S-box protein [Syntrophaceae bacterium]|nr:PAS domain S-box protein [Syntrophaceae bacterium]